MGASGLGLAGGALLVVFGVGGLRQVFGIWVRPLEAEFAADRAAVALVAALSLLAFGLGQPLAGRLVDVHGPRLIVPGAVLFAGLGAIGASQAGTLWQFALMFVMVTSLAYAGAANATIAAAVVQRFVRRQGLIFGIISAGAPLGQLLLAPLGALAIAAVGWRSTMAGFGLGLLLLVLPVAWWLLGRSPAPPRVVTPGLAGVYRAAFRQRPFVLLFGAYFLCGMTTLGLVHTHLVPYAADVGLPDVLGAQVLGLLGLANVFGLIGAGQAADRWGSRRPLIAAYGVRAFALLWLATATDELALVLFALVFGLTDMATVPLSAKAAAELFGSRMIGALMGLLVVAHQLGSAVGSYLAGLGYDLLGGYPPVIVVGVGLSLLATLFAVALEPRRRAADTPAVAAATT